MESITSNGISREFKIVKMMGDGSCLFRALAYHIFGSQESNLLMRKEIVEYIFNHWEELGQYTNNVHGEAYEDRYEYRKEMSKTGTYGSACEIMAATRLHPEYSFEVVVVDSGTVVGPYGNSDFIKRLRYTAKGGGHYDAYEDTERESNENILVQMEDDQQDETEQSVISQGSLQSSPPKEEDKVSSMSDSLKSTSKGGRPKKVKRGRPKISSLTSREQHQIAVKKYSTSHPEINREAVRKYNLENPGIGADRYSKYASKNPEALKRAKRNYKQKNPEVQKLAHKKYIANKPLSLKLAIKKYMAKKPLSLKIAIKRYMAKKPLALKNAINRYIGRNPIALKKAIIAFKTRYPHANSAAVKKYANMHVKKRQISQRNYLLRNSMANIIALRKFRTKISATREILRQNRMLQTKLIKGRVFSWKLKQNKENCILILKMHSKGTAISARLDAENKFKWVMTARNKCTSSLQRILMSLRTFCEALLLKMAAADLTTELFTVFQQLLGPSLHLPSQENYYYESAYNTLPSSNKPVVLDEKGTAMSIFPVPEEVTKYIKKKRAYWSCSPAVCNFTLQHYNSLKRLAATIVQTKFNKLPMINFKAHLITLKELSAHFQKLRTFTRRIYSILGAVTRVKKIDRALRTGNIDVINEIVEGIREVQSFQYELGKEDIVPQSEDEIIATLSKAFHLHKSTAMDLPVYDCISCNKLCSRKDGVVLGRQSKPIDTTQWKNLISFISVARQINKSDFICNYCSQKFRKNEIPPTCIMNDMYVEERPLEITCLNDYEKALIQRAKAFQVIVNMTPVGNKNIPNRQMVKKMKGRTFHLPLPIDGSLAKLPRPTEAVNTRDLFILMRGAPTKSKIVWEDLVNVTKVFKALQVLKMHNHLYKQIVLPSNPNRLLPQHKIPQVFHSAISNNDKNTERKSEESMITQMDTREDVDDYYAQFTIQPIHQQIKNVKTTALYQMLKVAATPIDNRERLLDVQCFPDLYFKGKFGQWHPRAITLSNADFIKARLMSVHSEFRLNQQYLFFLLNDTNLRQLNAGIYYKLNVSKFSGKLTAEEYMSKIRNDDLEGDLAAIFGKIRNTEQFWKQPRNDIQCMTQHYGPATFFLTLSPSEWLWEDLGDFVKENNVLSWDKKSVSELVALDPVSASRFMNIQFKAMLAFITSPDEPLGKVTHYFWRREYQSRGAQHFHLMLWVTNAPVLGESNIEDVAKFISKYISCSLPDGNLFPTLRNRVEKYQTHHHNSYCMRTKKGKFGTKRICRFSFPRETTKTLIIRDVVQSVAGRKTLTPNSRLYSLPRNSKEVFINDYNPAVMLAWNGNMDLQFVGEKSSVLNYYITKYTTKSEKSHTVDAFEQIVSTKSLSSRLFNVGLRALNHRECGALEASDTLLGIPLYGTDPKTTIKWLDTSMNRSRRVKDKHTIEKLDGESTDIYYQSWVDDYYPTRPKTLDNMSLYDFTRWYDKIYYKPKVKGDSSEESTYPLRKGQYMRKRKEPHLVNHYRHNPEQQPEKYYYSLLLMFKPWRNPDDLLNGKKTYTEAFQLSREVLEEAVKYANVLNHCKEAIDKAFEMIDSRVAEINAGEPEDDDAGPDHPDQFEDQLDNALEDFRGLNVQPAAQMKWEEMVQKLNIDQRRVFNHVTSIITEKRRILRHFTSGVGGTGKSFLISAIRTWVTQHLNMNTAVSAPTGVAAFNVSGLTIYRLLQLPVEHGSIPKYTYLSDTALQKFRAEFKDTVLFIIDEISMVSNLMLLYIHLRLTEIFGTSDEQDGWFGKKHILVLGDLLQLPPVHEKPPYIAMSSSDVKKYVGSLFAINLWSELFTYDELTINMRQNNDARFADALHRIRLGVPTKQDIEFLQCREIKLPSENITGRLHDLVAFLRTLPEITVCLLPTKHMCQTLNSAMLESLNSPMIKLTAKDSLDCPRYSRKKLTKKLDDLLEDSSITAGLEKDINLKIGAKIMLRRNIDVTIGLVNGSIGTLNSVIWDPNKPGIAKEIKVTFSHGLVINIEPVKTKFMVMPNAFVHRTQFPITLAYAITIHKSQGLSLESVVIDIGSSVFSCGQAYVALSRATTSKGLHLINFDPSQVKALDTALIEINRLRSQYRPNLPSLNTNTRKAGKKRDRPWTTVREADVIQDKMNNKPTKKNPRRRRRKN